jgi:hypothetical protein
MIPFYAALHEQGKTRKRQHYFFIKTKQLWEENRKQEANI